MPSNTYVQRPFPWLDFLRSILVIRSCCRYLVSHTTCISLEACGRLLCQTVPGPSHAPHMCAESINAAPCMFPASVCCSTSGNECVWQTRHFAGIVHPLIQYPGKPPAPPNMGPQERLLTGLALRTSLGRSAQDQCTSMKGWLILDEDAHCQHNTLGLFRELNVYLMQLSYPCQNCVQRGHLCISRLHG
jgi:hypothetical protein